MREFPLQIISPEKIIFKGQVISLVVPAQEGYLGVMAGHAPMLAALTLGEVKITTPDNKESLFAITGGVLEVDREGATIMGDFIERAEEIDKQRAEAAKTRAAERVVHPTEDVDVARAHAALMRAVNRLRVASKASGM